MKEQEEIVVDQKTMKRMERSIVVAEIENTKSRKRNDAQMIKYIIDKIEEEVKC